MLQNWISVAGIAIDLLGFLLLLREWWLAFFHESATLDFQQRRSWEMSLRHHHVTHASEQLKPHLDASHRIHDEMVERNARAKHMATLKSRKRAFVLATVLIIVGALLQLVGQIPPDLFQKLVHWTF
jgi:hypothetical protein